MMTIEELKQLIIERIDPDELVDILEVNTEEMCEAFEEFIIERRNRILERLDLDEEEGTDEWES